MLMKAKKNGKNKDEAENPEEEDLEESNEQDLDAQFEAAFSMGRADTWKVGGAKKDIAIRGLIQCFGSMIESFPSSNALPDHNGRYRAEDMIHRKLLDASKQVLRAKSILLDNENFETREFTLFISKKNWVGSILRPLIELCAKEDSSLAGTCASLVLVLIKKIEDSTMKKVKKILKSKKKQKALTAGTTAEELGSDSEIEDKTGVLGNVKEQTRALLSFKEALCSEKCSEAIINVFKQCWLKEQQADASDQEIKRMITVCFSYFRRILAISPHPQWSTANEILSHKSTHSKYIIQMRLILSLIPGILSDLRRNYHDDWLIEVILIIYYIVQNFEPTELFTVWKSKSLIADFASLLQLEDETATNSVAKRTLPAVAVPSRLSQATKQQVLLSKGSLTEKLSLERSQRHQQQLNACNRFSRFSSTYRIPVKPAVTALDPEPSAPSSSAAGALPASLLQQAQAVKPLGGPAPSLGAGPVAAVDEENLNRAINSSAILLKNPFESGADSIPQAKTKRSRKNMTYLPQNPATDAAVLQSKITVESQQACVVAASLVDLLTSAACLKSFVRRVNEDLRRDENRISSEMELNYFVVLTKFLHYNRLKLMDDYQEHLSAKKSDPSASWQPDLLNVIDTLDKMSFSRVLFCMERLQKDESLGKGGREHLWIPMGLYHEMICYLQILLLSDIEGHHEIAIGALYRLFYASSERLDPLHKLLTAWKPGLFSKKHLELLILLFEQTLKTLEAAKQIFHAQGIDTEEALKKSRQKHKKDKKEMDMEQYLLSSLRFDNLEYFRKFVTEHFVVDILTRLLRDLEHNDATINAVLLSVLRRLQQFDLEKTAEFSNSSALVLSFADLSRVQAQDQAKAHGQDMGVGEGTGNLRLARDEDRRLEQKLRSLVKPHPVNLAHLLLNVQTFLAMETLLSAAPHLLRSARVNQDAAVEPILELLRQLVRLFAELAAKNQLLFLEILFRHPRAQEHLLSVESVYEASLHAVRDFSSSSAHRTAPEQEEADETSAASSSSSEDSEASDLGDEFDETAYPNQTAGPAQAQAQGGGKRKKTAKEQRRLHRKPRASKAAAESPEDSEAPQQPTTSRRPWTSEEDFDLRTQYRRHKGVRNVFTLVAQALGGARSEVAIERRVIELQLHRELSDDDEADDIAMQPQQLADDSFPATTSPSSGDDHALFSSAASSALKTPADLSFLDGPADDLGRFDGDEDVAAGLARLSGQKRGRDEPPRKRGGLRKGRKLTAVDSPASDEEAQLLQLAEDEQQTAPQTVSSRRIRQLDSDEE